MLGLLKGDVVEVLQGRRKAVAALFGTLERKLHAALDDGLVNLGEGLTGFGCGGTRLRQHRVDFERNLLGSRHVLHGHRVEWVQERIRAHTEVVGGAAVALGDGRVLTGAVDDVNLIRGVGEDGARHLGLGEHTLTGAGLAADEAHRRGELLAVADHKVAAVLVLAVEVAACIVKLLRGKRHEDGNLRRGEHAGDFHVVMAEREDGIKSLTLAIVIGVKLDGVLTCRGDDAKYLRIQRFLALRVGVDKPREDIETLVLVLQVVEHVLRLLLGVFQLLREDGEVIAFVHCRALFLDDFLVNPCGTGAHVIDSLGFIHGLHVPRDSHGDAVLIHLVVADVVHHVFRGVALLSGIGHLIGQLLVPVL